MHRCDATRPRLRTFSPHNVPATAQKPASHTDRTFVVSKVAPRLVRFRTLAYVCANVMFVLRRSQRTPAMAYLSHFVAYRSNALSRVLLAASGMALDDVEIRIHWGLLNKNLLSRFELVWWHWPLTVCTCFSQLIVPLSVPTPSSSEYLVQAVLVQALPVRVVRPGTLAATWPALISVFMQFQRWCQVVVSPQGCWTVLWRR